MTILATTRVQKGYRITIPKEVRDFLDLFEGETIVFFTIEGMEGRVCIRRGSMERRKK